MDFRQAVRKCMIEKYRPMIEGRAARAEFWWFVLFLCLTCFAALVAMGLLVMGIVLPLTMSRTSAFFLTLGPFVPLLTMMLIAPLFYFLVPPLVAVTIRRLHDRDMSGWWYLGFIVAALIPVFNILVLFGMLILMVLPGTAGPNRFGADPLDQDQSSVFA